MKECCSPRSAPIDNVIRVSLRSVAGDFSTSASDELRRFTFHLTCLPIRFDCLELYSLGDTDDVIYLGTVPNQPPSETRSTRRRPWQGLAIPRALSSAASSRNAELDRMSDTGWWEASDRVWTSGAIRCSPAMASDLQLRDVTGTSY